MKLQFERLVVARYLEAKRSPERVRRLRYLTLALGLLTAALFLGHHLVERALKGSFSMALYDLAPLLRYAKYLAATALVLVGFFVELISRLSIFTTISTYGLFLGTGALVIVLSVMSGFEQDLKRKILGNHAHIVITTPDRPFNNYREVLERVQKVPGIIAGTPYLTSEVMLASSSNLSGVIIKGIDPDSIGRVTDLAKNTDMGSLENLRHPERLQKLQGLHPGPGALGTLPAPGDPAPKDADKAEPPRPRRLLQGVVIGRELSKNLRLFIGDDVNVVSPLGDIGPTGPIPKAKPFRVAAIFFSGMYEYDSKYIYMMLPAAQRFLSLGDEVSGIELKLVDPDHTDAVRRDIHAALSSLPEGARGYEVEDWMQLNRSLFSALKLEKIAMFIALCFIILVAAFSIISNGIMLVLEKGQEIAILKSMGASDGAVMRVFVLLGLYMGLLGTLAGILTGTVTCVLLDRYGIPLNSDVYYITKLPVNMNLSEVVAVLVASLLLALCATLYPAWQAARMRIVEGLR